MSQGKSNSATKHKEALLSACVGFQLKRDKSLLPYFVFDLNAGNGLNILERLKVRGSAVVMYDKLEEARRDAYIFACEKNKQRCYELSTRLIPQFPLPGVDAPYIRVECVRKDNRKFLPTVPLLIKDQGVSPLLAPGTIVADPNGMDVPVIEIAQAVTDCPDLDIFIHVSGLEAVMGWRRNHPTQSGDSYHPTKSIKSIDDVFTIPKSHWLISPRFGNGRGHWALFGSREWLPPLSLRALKMYSVESVEGKEILRMIRTGRNGNGVS